MLVVSVIHPLTTVCSASLAFTGLIINVFLTVRTGTMKIHIMMGLEYALLVPIYADTAQTKHFVSLVSRISSKILKENV